MSACTVASDNQILPAAARMARLMEPVTGSAAQGQTCHIGPGAPARLAALRGGASRLHA